MTITITVNNPYFLNGLQDMAQNSGMDVQTLCTAIVCKRAEEYNEAVKRHKRCMIAGMLPGKEKSDD